jgi:hypothetical protein
MARPSAERATSFGAFCAVPRGRRVPVGMCQAACDGARQYVIEPLMAAELDGRRRGFRTKVGTVKFASSD